MKPPKTRADAEDARLVRVTRIGLALPGAKRELRKDHARFVVRTRTFAYFLGDGIVSIACKADREEIARLLERDPMRYYSPDYIGPKGWIAFCLDVKPVDWREVQRLMTNGYRLVAPSTMAGSIR